MVAFTRTNEAPREDASRNLSAIDGLMKAFPALALIIVENGGDKLDPQRLTLRCSAA